MILMEIADIEGTSKITDHEGWIQCKTLRWEVGRKIPTESGKTMDRTRDVVSASEVVITKDMDSTSAKLFEAAGGTDGKEVKIHFVSGAGTAITVDAEWTLANTLVSHYEVKGDTNDAEEIIHLNFTSIEIKTTDKGPDEAAGSPYPVKYDRETGVLGG